MLIFMLLTLTIAVLVTLSNQPTAAARSGEADREAIVLAAFGVSTVSALQSIMNVKDKVEKAFPEAPVRLAFTSGKIRTIWGKRRQDPGWLESHPDILSDILEVKTPLAEIADLQSLGYKNIVVQSLHIFAGEEYMNLKNCLDALNAIKTIRAKHQPFRKLVLGRPALGEPGHERQYQVDIKEVAQAVRTDVQLARERGAALVYLGHGNANYPVSSMMFELEAIMRHTYPEIPIYVGVVEGLPDKSHVMSQLKRDRIGKVTLAPFMLVAGRHTSDDMAGDNEDSWKKTMIRAGIKVWCFQRGLGDLDAFADIYVRHLADAMADHDIPTGKITSFGPGFKAEHRLPHLEGCQFDTASNEVLTGRPL